MEATASAIKRSLNTFIKAADNGVPVTIMSYDKPVAVIISLADYEILKHAKVEVKFPGNK